MTNKPPSANYANSRAAIATVLNRRTDKALSVTVALMFLVLWLVFDQPEIGFWLAGFAAVAKAVANGTVWSGDES